MIIEGASFRDNHSTVGYEEGRVKRLLHRDYLPHYEKFIKSGLYDCLAEKKLIVRHYEQPSNINSSYPLELIPEEIPFISYPYEWSFNQLKDAAILTLEINKISLTYGMILKDASAFNVQFSGNRPIFIDTASFEIYEEGKTWHAYQQFCRHFIAPLALCSYTDIRFKQFLLSNLDGIPIEFCKKMLPKASLFNSGLFLHIWLNAIGLKAKFGVGSTYKQPKAKLLAIQEHLLNTIKQLNWKSGQTEWSNYYTQTNYSKYDGVQKERIVSLWTEQLNVNSILDLGANDGRYSRLLKDQASFILSTDYDEKAVDLNYLFSKEQSVENVQTIHLNFVNPTPAIGYGNQERKSFLERVNADLILALALIHHLFITHDIPFEKIAALLAKMGKYLIIEFPLPDDEKVQQIAQNKPHQFKNYCQESFLKAFDRFYTMKAVEEITGNKRLIYLYERKA